MGEKDLIIRGFNDGYLIQKHSPSLGVKIASGFKDPSHPYAEAFMNGSIECIKELGQDVVQFLTLLEKKKQKRSLDRDRDISHEL